MVEDLSVLPLPSLDLFVEVIVLPSLFVLLSSVLDLPLVLDAEPEADGAVEVTLLFLSVDVADEDAAAASLLMLVGVARGRRGAICCLTAAKGSHAEVRGARRRSEERRT